MTNKSFAILLAGAVTGTFAAVLLWPGVPSADAAVPVATAALASVMPAAPYPAVEASVFYSGCRAVRAAGKAPLYRGQPGYRSGMDGDGDGIACEPYRGAAAEADGEIGPRYDAPHRQTFGLWRRSRRY